MINKEELIDWLHEQIEFERRQLKKIISPNLAGGGMTIGSHDAYCHVLDFISGELND